MITTTIIFVVAIVLAIGLLLYNLQSFGTAEKPVNRGESANVYVAPENQWEISQIEDIVILSAGDSHDIVEYGFIWDLINNSDEVKCQKQLLFNAEHLIIDFTRASYFGHLSCEFHLLNVKYVEVNSKPIIFCGINDWVRDIFEMLQCRGADNSPELVEFRTLEEALTYCRDSK